MQAPQAVKIIRPPTTIRSHLESEAFKQAVAKALPKHLTADRFIRVACTAIMRTPKLLQCDQASFFNALLSLSQFGIEPDGRRAHLIPFENKKRQTVECQLIVDWKGLAELALRSGTIAKLHADLVCDKDDFAFDMGDILHHRIDFRQPRGAPYAAYAMAQTKTGERFVQVMTKDEIEAIRDNSHGWRAFKSGIAKQSPWQDSSGEMWKKTVFRRLSKWLPLSPEFRDAVDVDDDERVSASAHIDAASLVSVIPAALADPEPESETQPIETQTDDGDLGPQQAPPEPPPPAKPEPTVQSELAAMVLDAGYTLDELLKWGDATGNIPDADTIPDFERIHATVAKRLLRSKTGLLLGLKQARGAA